MGREFETNDHGVGRPERVFIVITFFPMRLILQLI